MRVVRSFVAQLPRLRAQESLLEAARTGIGSGTLRKDARRGFLRDWERMASGQGGDARPRYIGQRLMSMGLPLEVVPPSGPNA